MPLDNFGPVKFSIEGTFVDKPRLLMNGEDVAYDSLTIYHSPEFEYEDFDGKKIKEPASTYLSFSVSAKIGQLEANVSYRVKANDESGLSLEQVEAAGKPDFLKKKDEKDKDGKSKDDKKSPKKKKKPSKDDESEVGKAMLVGRGGIAPDANTRVYKRNLLEDMARSVLVVEDNDEEV